MSNYTQLMGTVGRASAADGETQPVRATKRMALQTANSQALFQEAVERGSCFSAANQTGVASQAGLSATTPVLSLYNPLGSGKNAVLWYAGCTPLVAFAAAAAIFLAAGTNLAAAPVTGTAATSRNLKLGGAAPSISAFLAATLPAAPVAIGLLGGGLTGAITTLPGITPYERWYNGGVILQPGSNISIQTSTASGALGLLCEFIWEEVEI